MASEVAAAEAGPTRVMSDEPLQSEFEHEQCTVFRDPASGALGVIAIHSTALGPAMGGLRLFPYATLDSAFGDALRLSQAMSFKNAAAGLPLGGGKAVLIDDSRWAEGRKERMLAVGKAVDALHGRYITAEDVGTTPADMDTIAEVTPYVAGRTVENGGRGDPSPWTARSVVAAISSAARVRLGRSELSGLRVGVEGVGHVGSRLIEILIAEGAEVAATDVDPRRLAHAEQLGAVALSRDELYGRDLDVFSPCAMGACVSTEVAQGLRAAVIAGAANNPLSGRAAALVLAERRILYVPDFLANCGGIIFVGAEALRLDESRAEELIQTAFARLDDLLAEAATHRRLPVDLAQELARKRMAAGPTP